MADWPSSSSARQGPWRPSPGALGARQAMCSLQECINSRMAPERPAHRGWRLTVSDCRPVALSALRRVQTWLACRTRPWLLRVPSAPVPLDSAGAAVLWCLYCPLDRTCQVGSPAHLRPSQRGQGRVCDWSPPRLSLRSGQRPRREDPSVATPTLADLDCSQSWRPGTSPGLWETAL